MECWVGVVGWISHIMFSDNIDCPKSADWAADNKFADYPVSDFAQAAQTPNGWSVGGKEKTFFETVPPVQGGPLAQIVQECRFMSRHTPVVGLAIAVGLIAFAGCEPQQPFYLKHVDGDLSHYKGVATEIEYPDVEADRLSDVSAAKRPFSLLNNEPQEIWNLTLEEAVRTALANNKVIRNIGGQIQGAPSFILSNLGGAPTIYDPAIAESDPRAGTEAALAAFDAQFASSVLWERADTPENVNPLLANIGSANIYEHDIGKFQAQLSKTSATGGQFSLTQTVNYDKDRFGYPLPDPALGILGAPYAYPSDWNVNLQAEWKQPLLQGAGTQFNRIAGPGATPGNYNGVMIARLNTDIALADFEASVRNLIIDVENAYWELYFSYRALDSAKAGRDSALATWRKIYTLYRIGGKGGEAEKEAQARENYYNFRVSVESLLGGNGTSLGGFQSIGTGVYQAESKLRYLMGIAATDGRLIRPKDEPTTAKVSFDWCDVLNEGLVRNEELRQQKWVVKNRELQLIAAKNFLLPRLDFDAQYRWLGLGNDLLPVPNGTGADFTALNSNAYSSLTGGQFQEWQLGLQLNMPLGFRREMAGVRNAQLSLTKERVKLQEAELELSHQLAFAVRDLETNYMLAQTNFSHRVAAQREVEAVTAAYETDTVTIDRVLEAQQRLAQAESNYYRSLADYNKSIAEVHFRKGSLLEYNGVYLAEGPWPGKAYFDARRRARARAAATYLDYGFTQPKVISRGPMEQHADAGTLPAGVRTDAPAAPATGSGQPEMVPAPEPQPAASAPAPAKSVTTSAAEPQASVSADGRADNGWNAAPPLPAVASERSAADGPVVAASWTTAEKGSYHEPGANPPLTTVDRSAAGWTGVQH